VTRCTRSAAALLAAALWLAVGSSGAAQQKVFRCGPDGSIYSQTPCVDGYEVNVADPRSAEQRKAAEDATKREGKTVEKMTRERQAQEAAATKQGGPRQTASPSSAKPAASAASGTAAKKPRADSGKPAASTKPTQP
jgi:hypothetical protein